MSYCQAFNAVALRNEIDQHLSRFKHKLSKIMCSFEPSLSVCTFQILFQIFDLGRCQTIIGIDILWAMVSTAHRWHWPPCGNLPSCSVTISGPGVVLSRSSRRVRLRNRFAVMNCSRCFFLKDSSSIMWRSRSCSCVLGMLLRLYKARWLWAFSDITIVWTNEKKAKMQISDSCAYFFLCFTTFI